MKAVIRVKVSHQAGFGHWVRQCHLAKALAKSGYNVTLFPDDYERLGPPPDGLVMAPVKSQNEFLELLPSSINLAILDIHETIPELISQIRTSAKYVVGFEDLGSGRNHLDCLIDSNLPPQFCREIAEQVKTLFGWNYSLLAPEYETVSKEPRDFSNGIQSLLITMGGTDPNKLTSRVVAPLLESFPELKITVVSGPGFIADENFSKLLKSPRVKNQAQPNSLAPLFLQHDAVICSGGVTLHEALASGTPAFVVPQVAHQEVLAKGLEEEGATRLAGQPGKVNHDTLIQALQTTPANLDSMSTAGRKLIDGCGLKRIVEFLSKLTSK
ncbi:MAG: hypothetical protein G3M70_12490 [Candidatus Nitronauta litoralis]|uniref:Glycosyl transferase family 28 C-terminal domain-containing protein n=1 Tax=Candidatus Nitronauta litoralis TaxID=2705533 RepID=A0A7T0BY74_9BACT|nr:MAG: hypothetical protein G3M70_12490 [Candidatus Nitronauta litoralis]